MSIKNTIVQSLQTGFIDYSVLSEKEYRPQILLNDTKNRVRVLTSLLHNLKYCEEFWFSVAFITTSGVATLINTLIELEERNIRGKILTSQYLNFTHPEALRRLQQLQNVDIRVATEEAFHIKGYLFKQGDLCNFILGSSNLTQGGLCTNKEWNLKLTATANSELIQNVEDLFLVDFESAQEITSEYIQNYEQFWRGNAPRQISQFSYVNRSKIIPNKMQGEALINLDSLRSEEKDRALLISATGTGKTYLAAFDVDRFKPKKFLFVVHRRTIALKAMESFQTIIGSKSMGLYSGNKQEVDKDYIFATVQTLSKEEHLKRFNPDSFDYIVVDETHRAGAASYQKLIEYFKPKFLLGMTATPERTDGADIFEVFDYNIAYEIRLHQALEEDMLCPFHYYGVSDLVIEDESVEDLTLFNRTQFEQRVDRILENAMKFGCDDGEVRGLIFCFRKEEAFALSEEFNNRTYKNRKYRTVVLTGGSSQKEREEAIALLESEDLDEKLDYIFTVDIFNEGIDIPIINQIIMLRPTQSPIIFVQQLGRGLRKTNNKEYLTVIDFIGNYTNNYLIPIALYGDYTYNKDSLRKMMSGESAYLPGASTINFDKISKERIFESISQANMSLLRDLLNDYRLLKSKIGRIPMMMDFLSYGYRDPFLYAVSKKSYLNFVNYAEKGLFALSKNDLDMLSLFALEINNGKRIEESLILRGLINHGKITVWELNRYLQDNFGYQTTTKMLNSFLSNLNFRFHSKKTKKTERDIVVLKDDAFQIGSDLQQALTNKTFKEYLLDNIAYSIETFHRKFDRELFSEGFIRYSKYSRKDVCRILGWDKDYSSTVYGYKTLDKATPCFVTYHKTDDISDTTKYNDHFISQSKFVWESRSKRTLESSEIQDLIASERILLFIKKEDSEGKDFYYIGDVTIVPEKIKETTMADKVTPVVQFVFQMVEPVEDNLFYYLTES